ncbi:hypothetical protein [Epibacterium ulvae]|uniref:50S ribosomal protein L35 n=1 Tax=Epibacterium ulvae TaxID=1156985 RepID=A0A1G5PJ65_9RHOB|nr:hypothetical protein [Epibacterium ulvae]SCZ49241.1 hypothetical protein SAMN04488118_10123 [Epibacterium ulvae]
MDPDLSLIVGLGLGVLSVPALLSSISDARAPRGGGVALMLAVALIVYAMLEKPGGYTLDDLPNVLSTVTNRYL